MGNDREFGRREHSRDELVALIPCQSLAGLIEATRTFFEQIMQIENRTERLKDPTPWSGHQQ